jgi:hypothetical protein
MRAFALLLLLLAVLTFLLPSYREAVPFRIDLADRDTRTVAVVLVAVGLVALAAAEL